MADKRTKDFEARYFDQLDKRFDSVDASIEHNTKTTEGGFRHLNGRVKKLEKRVFPEIPQTVQELPPFWKNPEIVKLLTYIVTFGIIISVIYAGLKGIKLPGLP